MCINMYWFMRLMCTNHLVLPFFTHFPSSIHHLGCLRWILTSFSSNIYFVLTFPSPHEAAGVGGKVFRQNIESVCVRSSEVSLLLKHVRITCERENVMVHVVCLVLSLFRFGNSYKKPVPSIASVHSRGIRTAEKHTLSPLPLQPPTIPIIFVLNVWK